MNGNKKVTSVLVTIALVIVLPVTIWFFTRSSDIEYAFLPKEYSEDILDEALIKYQNGEAESAEVFLENSKKIIFSGGETSVVTQAAREGEKLSGVTAEQFTKILSDLEKYLAKNGSKELLEGYTVHLWRLKAVAASTEKLGRDILTYSLSNGSFGTALASEVKIEIGVINVSENLGREEIKTIAIVQ